ncbi:MAG: hypothetical protein Q4G65_05410 [bacterium]|nr:hypothetical protein [bacterium]
MQNRTCPYCGETILAVAKKCRYCGEWLKESIEEKPMGRCGDGSVEVSNSGTSTLPKGRRDPSSRWWDAPGISSKIIICVLVGFIAFLVSILLFGPWGLGVMLLLGIWFFKEMKKGERDAGLNTAKEKRCENCGEIIPVYAKKCNHCGSYISLVYNPIYIVGEIPILILVLLVVYGFVRGYFEGEDMNQLEIKVTCAMNPKDINPISFWAYKCGLKWSR